MQSLITFDAPLSGVRRPIVFALGVFDGVHIGHRKILTELLSLAGKYDALPAAVTFWPHPREILGLEAPPLLLPLEERRRLLRQAGAAVTGVIRFTEDFSRMEPETFLEQLLESTPSPLAGICVGSQWRFGRGGRGNQEIIRDFASRRGIGFVPCREVELEGQTVSSSAIRKCTACGELALARRMLGRPVRLFGKVGQGNQVAGSVLNAPTANLEVQYGVLPPDGVYAGRVLLEGNSHPCAVNIGLAPTFGVNIRRVEAHLLDFSGCLYGKELELELFQYLREEKHFSSPESLMAQIGQDVAAVRERFREENR